MTGTPNDRYQLREGQPAMTAVVTTGNGGYDKLDVRQVPIPALKDGEVLLKVLAAGMNNTEINTRLGWYSASVTSSTEGAAEEETEPTENKADGGWNEKTPFPFIQGTDCCGEVVALASDVEQGQGGELLGRRVLVRACMHLEGFASPENVWMGSDFDGAFAQFVAVPATEVFPVACAWSSAELATIPCAYGTAENMLHRAAVQAGERVLVAGASGGVGSAVLQLAKRRGAHVIAIVSQGKQDQVRAMGADRVVDRNADLVAELGKDSIDVVVDNVAGAAFPQMLEVMKRRGRYVSSGAIGGPLVTLDMRSFYLKDLTLIGCTGWDAPVFPNLISYIERGEIRPLLAKTFPLAQIAAAQAEFLEKRHVGNFVLLP
ncbi:alcohol dehydrogenase family protein [Rhodovibrionaceae bacterium A322]